MQVKTLAVLSLLGMLTSSAAVWSLSAPRPTPEPVPELGPKSPVRPLADPSQATFSSGRTVRLEGRLGHAVIASDRDQESFVLFRASADRGVVAPSPASVNLAIVLDRSGSMRGKRLKNAMAAARGMIGRLRDGDVVSLITYNTETQVMVSPTVIDLESRSRVLSAIADVTARGDTCISCGLEHAERLLAEHAGMVDRILLLSDGEATAGVRDRDGFVSLAQRLRAQNVAISTVGVDVEYDERTMAALAQESNGRHYFVENPSGLAPIFDQELESLKQTLAQEAELTLSLAPGVELLEIADRGFIRRGETIEVPLGSFTAGEEKTVLGRVRVPGGEPGPLPVVRARLDYRDRVAGAPGRCEGRLAARVTDRADQISELDAVVAERVLRSETARTLTEANRLWREGRADEARLALRSRLSSVRAKKKATTRSTPKPMRAAVARDLERQEAALDDAAEGFDGPFASAPSTPSRPGAKPASGGGAPVFAQPAPAGRAASAQVKKNQEVATELSH